MRHLKWLLPAVVLLFVAVAGGRYILTFSAQARAELRLARQATDSALGVAASALAHDSAHTAEDARLKVLADSARAEALRFKHQAAVARARFADATDSAPDTCDVVIALADAAFAEQDSLLIATEAERDIALTRALGLQIDRDSLRAALVLLRGSTVTLARAADAVASPRRSLLARLTPRFGFGVAGGVDPSGRPNAVVGVTFGWPL